MTNKSCPWNLFDEYEKKTIDYQIDTTVAMSCLLLTFLIPAYLNKSPKNNLSYYCIGRFFTFAWLRRCCPIIFNYIIINKQSEFWQDKYLCEVSAILETFMAVYEVECLTLICVERFVVAKYYTKGWVVPPKYYAMFHHVGVLFASAYSPGLLLGFYAFGPDFTCSSCTVDMILPDGLLKYYLVIVFIMRSIKPACLMIIMLISCKKYERAYDDSENNKLQRQITRNVIAMTVISLLCWTPIALIRGQVILMQLVYGPGAVFQPSAFYVKWALLLHWNSMTPTALALVLLDRNIREATLKFCFRGILRDVLKVKKE